jgi:hypothetical protein
VFADNEPEVQPDRVFSNMWLGATYPLGGVLTNLGSGAFIMALPIAGGAVALALFSMRKKGATPSV